MLTEKNVKKSQKLSHEILGLSAVTLMVSIFLFQFLSLTALAIVENYCDQNDLILTYVQQEEIDMWILTISFLMSVIFFIVLFLFLLGQKISYIAQITAGIDALQENKLDHVVPIEGCNELTQLAENINYLSATQKQLKEKEQAFQAEKEQLIRTLSHDIRTPLTSILSYSEFLLQKNNDPQEQRAYLELIQKKGEQIKELTDILLDGGRRNPELFEDAHLLMEQLVFEVQESLEDDFILETDMTGCPHFSGRFDVQELRRIFDNLISNIQKYADPQKPVTLALWYAQDQLYIRQTNFIKESDETTESYQMGLNSIRRIAHNYHGTVEILQDETTFSITIILSDLL